VAEIEQAHIREAIERALASGRTRIDDVAQLLLTSKSTLQRRLKAHRTTFTKLRREVQLHTALRLLTSGRSVARVAEEVALSPDHLCVVVREATELTPRQINRAARLADRLRRWEAHVPVAFGTQIYQRRLREWKRIDAELFDLLGDLGPDHPLVAWANELLELSARPDYRRKAYRDRLRAESRREGEELGTLLRKAADNLGGAAAR